MPTQNYEKTVIIFILIFGFLGAVILIYFDLPAIIPSIFLATGIATLVYHFLGGITVAEFNMGPVKLGGSIAALIASGWFINSELANQISNSDTHLEINSNLEIINDKGTILGKIELGNKDLILDTSLQVLFDDSIEIGKLKLGSLKLDKDFGIETNDDVHLGSIGIKEIQKIGLFNDSELIDYAEIRYDLKLEAPYTARENETFWDGANTDLKNTYRLLPFTVEPKFIGGADQTVIIRKDKPTDLSETEKLEKGTKFKVKSRPQDEVQYFVRVRNAKRTAAKNSYDNYVIYQIFVVKGKLSEK